jgi:hypothetical protein
MAKRKLSVSLDRDRLAHAASLVEADSTSELVEIALARLIDEELERRHVAGYLRHPVDTDTDRWAEMDRELLTDEVDWAALYGVER